jgi:hypothetical protein
MTPPLPVSLSERLKSTIDPITGSCKHHPSIQLCQLVANGTRWSIVRKVCIKCGSRAPVGGLHRHKSGKAVTNPGRPAPGKLHPKERAEAERKEREEASGTLREREAKQLQKEIDATKARRKQKEIDTIESTSISYDPSSNSSRRSTSVDKVSEGERSGVDDRFTVVKQPSALRLRDKSRAGRRRSSDIVTESERSSVTLHLRDKSLGRRRSSDIITESERGSVALRLRDKSRAGRRRSSDIVTESERGSVDLRLRDKTRGRRRDDREARRLFKEIEAPNNTSLNGFPSEVLVLLSSSDKSPGRRRISESESSCDDDRFNVTQRSASCSRDFRVNPSALLKAFYH